MDELNLVQQIILFLYIRIREAQRRKFDMLLYVMFALLIFYAVGWFLSR